MICWHQRKKSNLRKLVYRNMIASNNYAQRVKYGGGGGANETEVHNF